ncbi:hypothetical protein ACFY1V_19960 [Streptomyces sp. NPDC001255]|uniref:hypothetical protein n=1 Tax=Streptomyces sp. NPDC001255 TaxID=3364550 RepID=UPI0036B756E8
MRKILRERKERDLPTVEELQRQDAQWRQQQEQKAQEAQEAEKVLSEMHGELAALQAAVAQEAHDARPGRRGPGGVGPAAWGRLDLGAGGPLRVDVLARRGPGHFVGGGAAGQGAHRYAGQVRARGGV